MTDIDLIAPPDVMQRTAQRAKALRLAQNITQQELADKTGIHSSWGDPGQKCNRTK